MSTNFDYTAQAVRFSGRFPALSYVGIQVTFWIAANVLLAVIMYMQSLIISSSLGVPVAGGLASTVVIAIIFGVVYGVTLGLADYYLDKNVFRKKPLGKVILLKAFISLAAIIMLLVIMRFVLFDSLIAPAMNVTMNDRSWDYLFYILMIYYFSMTLMVSFINQVNKKYGPGVLLPLLLGKYRSPREEERIFMFMDLKSSTATAEKLGHLKYSSFIRDCFMDINQVLLPYRAEVYQYVGDEIVVTWREIEGLKDHFCIKFFFACRAQLQERAEYYMTQYGLLPDFKAGLHTGIVTAVEIGEIKRDIAYHGDTLNTAARIQHVCNQFNRSFLVSKYLVERIGPNQSIKTEELGMILLKGKALEVGIVSVEFIEVAI